MELEPMKRKIQPMEDIHGQESRRNRFALTPPDPKPEMVDSIILLEGTNLFVGFNARGGTATSESPIVKKWPVYGIPRIGESFGDGIDTAYRVVDLIWGCITLIGNKPMVTLVVRELD